MEFFFRELRSLSHWWEMLWFRRRWNRLYDKAVRIEGVADIHLTVYAEPTRQAIQNSTLRIWERIPQEARAALANHWKRLQRSWDGRKTGIRLHLPIYGVFDSGFETAADYGNLIGRAFKSQIWSDYNNSPDSLMDLFAGMFLVLYDSQTAAAELDLHIARRFANHFLWMNERGDQSDLFSSSTTKRTSCCRSGALKTNWLRSSAIDYPASLQPRHSAGFLIFRLGRR